MAFRRATIVSGPSLCAASLWLIVGGLPGSAAAEIPEPIRHALESNARSLSPISVAWERTRTSDLPRSRALSLVGGQLSSWFLPNKSRFMWENGRFYGHAVNLAVQFDTQPDGRITERAGVPPYKVEVEVAFDGKKYYNIGKYEIDYRPAFVMVDTPAHILANKEDVRFHTGNDFFNHVGFHFPERAEDFEAKRPAKSLPLYLVEQGASVIRVGREEVGGVSCTALVLRTGTAQIRFILDPVKGYSVRRRIEETPSGELAVRADCSDFTEVTSGLWMPRKVEVEWHTWPRFLLKPITEAVLRETFRVSELKSEPIPIEQFVLKYNDPGTIVSDGTIEGKKDATGRISYDVPADPSRLDEVIKAAASGKNVEPTVVSFRRNFILANVLLILILIGVVWWRAGRKSR